MVAPSEPLRPVSLLPQYLDFLYSSLHSGVIGEQGEEVSIQYGPGTLDLSVFSLLRPCSLLFPPTQPYGGGHLSPLLVPVGRLRLEGRAGIE